MAAREERADIVRVQAAAEDAAAFNCLSHPRCER
jgi:hypothetical protein